MANATRLSGAASMIRDEDLQDMEEFQRDLEDKISRAHDDGRAYMMAQYVRLLATVQSEIKRIRNRFEREKIAAHRRTERDLRKKAVHTAPHTAARDTSSMENDA